MRGSLGVVVRFHRAALTELDAAADYYEAQSPGLGDRFLDCVGVGLRRMEQFPDAWPRPTAFAAPREVRQVPLRPFQECLVYVATPTLMVLAVAHGARSPGYWKERLGRE